MKLIVSASPINPPNLYHSGLTAVIVPLTVDYLVQTFERQEHARSIHAMDRSFRGLLFRDIVPIASSGSDEWEDLTDVDGVPIQENVDNSETSLVDLTVPDGGIYRTSSINMVVTENTVYWKIWPEYESIQGESADISYFLREANKAHDEGNMALMLSMCCNSK